MIIEFIVTNFRSIKNEAILSFEANSSKVKEGNYFNTTTESEGFKLTHSIAIYGANASGKSNIITAFHALIFLITSSQEIKAGKAIPCYEPFLFDVNTKNADCEFSITFILNGMKYRLDVKYNGHIIIEEKLSYFRSKRATFLYERIKPKNANDIQHKVKFNKEHLPSEGVKKEVHANQLFLSKFNSNDIHSILTPICLFFANIETEISYNNPIGTLKTRWLNEQIAKDIVSDNESHMKDRLLRLITISDIQIADINIKERSREEFNFPDDIPDDDKSSFIEKNKWKIEFIHKVYDQSNEVGFAPLPIYEESLGSQILFGLGARILKTLDKGGVLIYDELDNSLHPRLSRLLVRLFNNKVSNPHNAQLIFTTHEVSIIDKEMLRSDQIWFVEKNKEGSSDLFSAQDFDGIREDMPFDKWYQAGRFGGLPTIGDIDYVFDI